MLTTSSVSKRPVVTSLARWMLRKASRSFMSLLGSLGPRRGRPMASGERLAEFGRCSVGRIARAVALAVDIARRGQQRAGLDGGAREAPTAFESHRETALGWAGPPRQRRGGPVRRGAQHTHRPYEQIGRVTRAKQSPKWPDQMPASSPGWLRRMIVVRLCASMVNSVQDGEVRAGVQLCRTTQSTSVMVEPTGVTRTSPSA